MSFLREPGDLARTPLAAILLEAWNFRLTGELTVHQPGGDSRLFFRDGVPVGAQTFAGFHPLGQILLARGEIDIETLGRSLSEMARTGRRQGEVLVEMGAVRQDVVDRALEEQQAAYVALIAGLTEGAFRFDAAAPVPEWAGRVLVAPLRAVVDALASPQAAALAASALGSADGSLELGTAYAELAPAFSWSAAEQGLVRAVERGSSVQALLRAEGLPPERARAVLAALLLLGLAERATEVVDIGALASGAAPADVRPPAADPGRRSDPEEARSRRQRLLARAMQNMGVGPLAAPPPHRQAPPEARPPQGPRSPEEVEIRRALEAALPSARDADLFGRLGLPRGATSEEVKGAYLRLVKQFHPDRFASPSLADLQPGLRELLAALNEAYATLSDRVRRGDYLARTSTGGRAASEAAAAAARADFQKAEAARRAGDHARARLFLEAAVRGDRRPDYLVALAQAHLALGKPDDRERARRHLDEAMKDPTCSRAFLAAGTLAREEDDWDQAERLFRAALRADPRSEEAAQALRQVQGRKQSRADDRVDAKK
jgi:curved DNA-binding protein CbpA